MQIAQAPPLAKFSTRSSLASAEFINFNALASTATPEQRQAFLDSFLVTTRTLRPRQISLGIRIDF